jgi:hypothetical protein
MKYVRWIGAAGLAFALSGSALAADIARLEWGSFVIEADSSNGWGEYKTASSDDGRSLTMTFSPFEAKADGATFEASARLSGHYDLVQPNFDSFSTCIVTVEGHIIKSSAATVRLVVKAGPGEQIIEWETGKDVSEKFSRQVEIAIPGGGRLPNPFPVSIEALAKKDDAASAAYISVDSLTITAGNTKLAAN